MEAAEMDAIRISSEYPIVRIDSSKPRAEMGLPTPLQLGKKGADEGVAAAKAGASNRAVKGDILAKFTEVRVADMVKGSSDQKKKFNMGQTPKSWPAIEWKEGWS
ncbi:MAG: DUF6470 family protein [Actinomycetota bacterium]|nr:DUF6470 family protein [Actinomycetota bacterium]